MSLSENLFQPNLGKNLLLLAAAPREGGRLACTTKAEYPRSVVRRNIHTATIATRAQSKYCYPHIPTINVQISIQLFIYKDKNTDTKLMLYIKYSIEMFCVYIRKFMRNCELCVMSVIWIYMCIVWHVYLLNVVIWKTFRWLFDIFKFSSMLFLPKLHFDIMKL